MTEKSTTPPPTGLALLRQPVDERYIAKLPKPTKQQTEAVRTDFKNGARCNLCGAWHHPQVVHLDYVGHAATTARLLEADEHWTWEPLAFDASGLPKMDDTGGLWIKLTVAGQMRFGYGHADVKPNADAGSRVKEAIGDAIRNAAMRFGWALDLWHKGGDLFQPSVHEDDSGAGGSERPGEGGQRGEPTQGHPPEDVPPRTAPQRRSAADASAQAAATPSDGVGVGKLKNLQMKIKAAGMDDDTIKTMLEAMGVPEISAAMSEADWKKVKAKVERFAAGG